MPAIQLSSPNGTHLANTSQCQPYSYLQQIEHTWQTPASAINTAICTKWNTPGQHQPVPALQLSSANGTHLANTSKCQPYSYLHQMEHTWPTPASASHTAFFSKLNTPVQHQPVPAIQLSSPNGTHLSNSSKCQPFIYLHQMEHTWPTPAGAIRTAILSKWNTPGM